MPESSTRPEPADARVPGCTSIWCSPPWPLLSSWPAVGICLRFSPKVPDVISAAAVLLWPLVLYQYLDAFQLTLCNAIRGTSQVKPLWISVVSYMITGVPVLLLFADVLGEWHNLGVYYSFDVALLVAALIAWIVFRRTKIEGAEVDIAESMKKITNFVIEKKSIHRRRMPRIVKTAVSGAQVP